MFWLIEDNGDGVDESFISSFSEAGPLDEAVVRAWTTGTGREFRPQNAPEIPRYYYLLADDPRIKLVVVGEPLSNWRGQSAGFIVGTLEIIGEFALNKRYKGQKGLSLRMESPQRYRGEPDIVFESGSSLLEAISTQVLDLPLLAKRAQEQAAKKAARLRKQQRPKRFGVL